MTFFVVGLNHKTAPVELREQLAVNPSSLVGQASELKLRGDLDEIVLLSTCNRVEIYAAARHPGCINHSLLGSLSAEPHDFRSCAYTCAGREAVRHLFRVAAGMDSMVLGETEISGQVKQAYETARAAKLTVRIGNRLILIAPAEIDWIEAAGDYAQLHVGKKAWLMREPMSVLDARLIPLGFTRIHRSTIVNTDRVVELRALDDGEYTVVLRDGTALKLSRSYRHAVPMLLQSGV